MDFSLDPSCLSWSIYKFIEQNEVSIIYIFLERGALLALFPKAV